MNTAAVPVRGIRAGPLRQTVRGLGCAALLTVMPVIQAAGEPVITAVASQVSEDYVRQKLPGGQYAAEYYAFGEGGIWGGAMHDESIDRMKFLDVARTIAGPLSGQGYRPSHDAKQTGLLIMVYWGMTNGTGGASSSVAYQNLQASQTMPSPPPPPPGPRGAAAAPGADSAGSSGPSDVLLAQVAMENRLRDRADAQNASLLGYDAEGLIGTDYGRALALTPFRSRVQDLTEEVEENRYFVVLMAYDFQLLVKQKQHKLLWVTRFSIRQRGSDFDRQLAAMAQAASRYFGQDSHGLLRKPLPEEHVTLGELQVIGIEPDKK